MASNIQVVVDETKAGLMIRWLEDGLERHVWVGHERFEKMLASGETVYVDTPAIATEQPLASSRDQATSQRDSGAKRSARKSMKVRKGKELARV